MKISKISTDLVMNLCEQIILHTLQYDNHYKSSFISTFEWTMKDQWCEHFCVHACNPHPTCVFNVTH